MMQREDKSRLRDGLRAQRAALGKDRQQADAQQVRARIGELAAYRQARVVMAYVAIRGELSLDGVLKDVLSSGRMLVLPRCEEKGILRACIVPDLSALERGAYGIFAPSSGAATVSPEQIDLILTPGVAFDRMGHRIGQGGGYYDRFLPATRALRVGVCHDFALLDEIPFEPHDARMDVIVTPSRTIFTAEEAIT